MEGRPSPLPSDSIIGLEAPLIEGAPKGRGEISSVSRQFWGFNVTTGFLNRPIAFQLEVWPYTNDSPARRRRERPRRSRSHQTARRRKPVAGLRRPCKTAKLVKRSVK